MASPETGTPVAGDAPPSAASEAGLDSMLHVVQDIWREIPGLLSDRVELLTLELKRAGLALARVVMLVVATVVFAVTAWLLLWGCIVAALVQVGLPFPAVLFAALVFNLLATWLAVARARALLPRLSLPATRRHLMLGHSNPPDSTAARPAPHEHPDPFNPASQPAAR
jgi:hypothetical protein